MPRHPLLERVGRKLWQTPLWRDPERGLQRSGDRTNAGERVHQPGHASRGNRPPVDVPEQVFPEWMRLPRVVVREELGLVRRHVDADWTFRFARLAGEAEIQRVLDLCAFPSGGDGLPAQHLEQEVGTTARRVALL